MDQIADIYKQGNVGNSAVTAIKSNPGNEVRDASPTKELEGIHINFEQDATKTKPFKLTRDYQPLKEHDVKMAYTDVGAYIDNGAWSVFQYRGNEGKPIEIKFSKPLQVNSLKVANYYPSAAELVMAAYADVHGKKLLGVYKMDLVARPGGEKGKDLNYQLVKEPGEWGDKVMLLKMRAKGSSKAAVHVDDLRVTVP